MIDFIDRIEPIELDTAQVLDKLLDTHTASIWHYCRGVRYTISVVCCVVCYKKELSIQHTVLVVRCMYVL